MFDQPSIDENQIRPPGIFPATARQPLDNLSEDLKVVRVEKPVIGEHLTDGSRTNVELEVRIFGRAEISGKEEIPGIPSPRVEVFPARVEQP